jgi:hypothetical protein
LTDAFGLLIDRIPLVEHIGDIESWAALSRGRWHSPQCRIT